MYYQTFSVLNSGYVSHLCQNYPEIILEGISESSDFINSLMEKLEIEPMQTTLTSKQTAELISGKCGLSQRGYKALRTILLKQKVKLPRYEKLVEHLSELDVGTISKIVCNCEGCMGYRTKLSETLEMVVNSEKHELKFPTEEGQRKLFEFLSEHNPALYSSLDVTKRTFFLRQTGDNFRAAGKMPTEQISVSILNSTKMIGSPYGQFINCLYRGNESRDILRAHCQAYFKELDLAAKQGLTLSVKGKEEHFNILVFLVADIGLLEKILGKCSSTSLYGCFWCNKHKQQWDNPKAPKGKAQSIPEMARMGKEGERVLGENPNHKSSQFTNFQQSHLGQYVS